MAESAEAVRLPNPFSSAQREGRELTVKFVLWETLARHYPNGARVAELEKDERLLEMRPKMRAAKNLNGQARSGGQELGLLSLPPVAAAVHCCCRGYCASASPAPHHLLPGCRSRGSWAATRESTSSRTSTASRAFGACG